MPFHRKGFFMLLAFVCIKRNRDHVICWLVPTEILICYHEDTDLLLWLYWHTTMVILTCYHGYNDLLYHGDTGMLSRWYSVMLPWWYSGMLPWWYSVMLPWRYWHVIVVILCHVTTVILTCYRALCLAATVCLRVSSVHEGHCNLMVSIWFSRQAIPENRKNLRLNMCKNS